MEFFNFQENEKYTGMLSLIMYRDKKKAQTMKKHWN